MTKRYSCLILTLLLGLSAVMPVGSAAGQIRYDFHNLAWGMNKAAVKKIEQAKLVGEETSQLSYSGEIENQPGTVRYSFDQDKLDGVEYMIVEQDRQEFCLRDEKNPEENRYLDVFRKIRDTLVREHGKPANQYTTWKDKLYEDDPNRWGVAIWLGDLTMGYRWKTPRANIELKIYGDNYLTHLSIKYDRR